MNTPDLCKAKWVKEVFNLYPTRLKCILKFREIIGINDTDIFILSLWYSALINIITITTYSYLYEGFIELFSKQDLLKQKKHLSSNPRHLSL